MNQPTSTHKCPCDTPEPIPGERLEDEAFKCVVKLTPLVSIDLIVRDPDGRIWLGKRKNRPAKNALFLPGGRITKNEKREDAFERITQEELGVKIPISKAMFPNSYDHVYTDNYSEKGGFGTHYVTLGYEIPWEEKIDPISTRQHTDCDWMTEEKLLESSEVHEYTKKYFKGGAIRSENQYTVVATRRNSFNSMLWQTPALSLTAQAFLLNVAGNKNVDDVGRATACILAFCVACCTVQLFARHRWHEVRDARRLEEFERSHWHLGYDVINEGPKRGHVWEFWKWSSFRVWIAMLTTFAIASLFLLATIVWQARSSKQQEGVGGAKVRSTQTISTANAIAKRVNKNQLLSGRPATELGAQDSLSTINSTNGFATNRVPIGPTQIPATNSAK